MLPHGRPNANEQLKRSKSYPGSYWALDVRSYAYTSQTTSQYVRLYRAALEGNWQDAKEILDANPDAIRYSITHTKESVLHIAFASKHMAFVKEVVQLMSDDDLELRNIDGDTALCFAAKSGIVTIAEEMVKKNSRLPLIRSSKERTPLWIAASHGHRKMVSYLLSLTPFEGLHPNERVDIFIATITYDMYDIALEILKFDQIRMEEKYILALNELARKPFAIGSKGFKGIRDRVFRLKSVTTLIVEELVDRLKEIRLFEDRQYSSTVSTLLFEAAEFGNAKFLTVLIHSYPNIVWTTDHNDRSLFHIAVINRQESVFNLIYETVAVKEILVTYIDSSKQNILHLAGKLAPPNRLNVVPGAALQMQREWLWFKEIEKIVPPSYLNMKDSKNLTPREVFTMEHEKLRREGEKWMKDTVNFYIIVATLITAVVFAAAFTVPGGSNQDTGIPILLKSIWFRVFFISDAIALLSSSTSILIFLSILTSRFTEKDFHEPLPLQWALGLIALFISVAGMMVAFSASCFLVFKSQMESLPIIIIAFASGLIYLSARLHFSLWDDIIRSLYLSRSVIGPTHQFLPFSFFNFNFLNFF